MSVANRSRQQAIEEGRIWDPRNECLSREELELLQFSRLKETLLRIERSVPTYREKFREAVAILKPVLPVAAPPAGFYLWPRTPLPDTEFAGRLYAEQHVSVLPGSFLARDAHEGSPGAGHVRIALVATADECREAVWRIRRFCEQL